MTLPEWGRKVLLLAIIPVPHHVKCRRPLAVAGLDNAQFNHYVEFSLFAVTNLSGASLCGRAKTG